MVNSDILYDLKKIEETTSAKMKGLKFNILYKVKLPNGSVSFQSSIALLVFTCFLFKYLAGVFKFLFYHHCWLFVN